MYTRLDAKLSKLLKAFSGWIEYRIAYDKNRRLTHKVTNQSQAFFLQKAKIVMAVVFVVGVRLDVGVPE